MLKHIYLSKKSCFELSVACLVYIQRHIKVICTAVLKHWTAPPSCNYSYLSYMLLKSRNGKVRQRFI